MPLWWDQTCWLRKAPIPIKLDDYQVALPPSSWYDYWTGSRIDPSSGRKGIDNAAIAQPEVHIHRTLETLPVFVRAGSIVPNSRWFRVQRRSRMGR